MNTKQIKTVVTTGAGVAAGLVAANMVGRMAFAQANPIIGILLPFAGAVAIKSFMGKGGDSLAIGMAAQGINKAVQQYLPSVASTVGIAGTAYPRSTMLPGVSGNYGVYGTGQNYGGDIVFD